MMQSLFDVMHKGGNIEPYDDGDVVVVLIRPISKNATKFITQ